jgi:hypothetical protein
MSSFAELCFHAGKDCIGRVDIWGRKGSHSLKEDKVESTMLRCKIGVRRPGRAESNALPEAASVKIFFNPITSLRTLRVKVFIQQKHSNRIII